jgi:hypothetical protein
MTLLDSGASDHCFVKQDIFEQYERLDPPRTGHSAGKGSIFNIEGVGRAVFLTNVDGTTLKVNMDGALHTPHLRSNLISVSKLVSKGSRVSFEGEVAIVYNTKGRKVISATRRDGLYVMNVTNPVANIAQSSRKPVPFDIWHRHFAHAPIDTIARMAREDLVGGLKASGEPRLDALCEDCIFGKHTMHPFHNRPITETTALECVYVDIWGPAPVESAGRAKYFMLLIDGATSYRTIYFLQSKTAESTLKVFKEFHKEAERQTGEKLKRVRLDMGREWLNAQWDNYAKENGILLDFTTPYAHQQNGKAERSMHNIARTMLADAGLSAKYWADAVHTASYTRNFIPSSQNPSTIPAAAWYKLHQDVSHLRPFGSTAYAHIPAEVSLSKLSPRSVKLTLIGYFGHTGYKLLDCSTGTVHKLRDVVFEETRPHYSTDTIITYPYDFDRPSSDNAIAPRPKPISTLHPVPAPTVPTNGPPVDSSLPFDTPKPPTPQITSTDDSENEVADLLGNIDGDSVAVRRTRREVRPSARMRESLEYLNRTHANMADTAHDDSRTRVPRTYLEAMRHPDIWFEPMLKELGIMKEKSVYRLVPRPLGRNVVQSRWVFANMYDESGTISAHKARLVAKGFTQVLGEDYDETYASVARLESVCLVCTVAASMGLQLWQVDFVSAFLNSENAYQVYMEQPPGFEEGGDDDVWVLLKTLYGTMQGAHDWAETLEKTYQGHRYYTSKADPQVRSRLENDELTLTSTWTDNILGALTTEAGETKAKGELRSSYEIKDLGTAKFILGMRIDRDPDTGTIRLSQRAYSKQILERFHMSDAKPRTTPLPLGITLSIDDMPKTKDELQDMKGIPYREALGLLMWLQVATRPDLLYAVNVLSRFANNPGQAHWNAMKHTLAYLKDTLDYGISYRWDTSLRPYGYVDADYAGDKDGHRSMEGHIFFVAQGPVSWASKQQNTVALSTVEAEFMAFTRAIQQAIWMTKFMGKIGLPQATPVNIFADNTGAIANTANYKNHSRTKHIDIRYHFTKEKVASGEIAFTYIPSSDNLADILTKPLPKEAILRCCSGIGLLPGSTSPKQGEY